MELISTDDYFILQHLQRSETSLWVCRKTGTYSVRPPWDLAAQENPECLGLVWGLYGKLSIHPDVCERLVLVRRCDRVGELPGPRLRRHAVYRVGDVVLVPLVPPHQVPGEVPLSQQLGLKPCPKHHGGVVEHADFRGTVDDKSKNSGSDSKLKILGGSLKILATDTFKSTAGNAAFFLPSQVKAPFKGSNVSKTVERFEKRILEEFTKMFTDSNSFYFSLTGDITNALQRQVKRVPMTAKNSMTGEEIELFPTWRDVDDRFFFNRTMVQEIIDLGDQRLDAWITPFIQGYVEIRECNLDLSAEDGLFPQQQQQPQDPAASNLPEFYTIALISRRSRYRAGTRYKRRGVDFDGHVANYVETEQITVYHNYVVSFLQVRGSIPLYWSQPGIRYRPPPRLDANPEEDKAAFAKHFKEEFDIYGPNVNCVSLVEKTGREKVVGDAYLENALAFDNPDLNFVYFDFHEYCRGMHFENVQILIQALEEEMIRAMRYCWLDRHGVVCTQQGVFRINCIDCLDRTNVVQTSIAKSVLETQLVKLGLIPPEHGLPNDVRSVFQGLWANNGDALSRQYAGTNALKGDFTRTGERNFSGLMKDGVNSASRYYLNQFRDAYRQATIDIITGQIVSDSIVAGKLEDEVSGNSQFYDGEQEEQDTEDHSATAERVKGIIEDCKKLLIPDTDSIVGAWGLIDNDPVSGDPTQEDMDVIVILTKDSYYVAHYDDEVDKVTSYQRVALADIEKLELGVPDQPAFQLSFRQQANKNSHSLRINYRMPPPATAVYFDADRDSALTLEPSPASSKGGALSGYFHMFRATNLRFFNNMAIVVKTDEERIECLKSVADSIVVSMDLAGFPPAPLVHGKLEKRRSRIPEVLDGQSNEVGAAATTKAVSRAFSSVTNQFSKLNPINKLRQTGNRSNANATKTTPDICVSDEAQQQPPPSSLQDAGVDNQLSNPTSQTNPGVARPTTLDPATATTSGTILLNQSLAPGPIESGGKKLTHMLSPLLSPSGGGAQGKYGSTSKLNLLNSQLLSPKMTRKLSRSSEDIHKESAAGPGSAGSAAGASGASGGGLNFLGVVELDASGDLKVKGGSLQKDLDIASQVLEESAVETAAMIEKGVLNPFTKLTKGLGAVLGNKTSPQHQQQQQHQGVEVAVEAVDDQQQQHPQAQVFVEGATPTEGFAPRFSQSAQAANQVLKAKIAEANSKTTVLLL